MKTIQLKINPNLFFAGLESKLAMEDGKSKMGNVKIGGKMEM